MGGPFRKEEGGLGSVVDPETSGMSVVVTNIWRQWEMLALTLRYQSRTIGPRAGFSLGLGVSELLSLEWRTGENGVLFSSTTQHTAAGTQMDIHSQTYR